MSSNGKIDRRARRTRHALTQALLSLGAEKRFAEIDIRELTRTAGVGRSTFYAHYADKDDFLASSVIGMIGHFEAAAAKNQSDRADPLPARQLFEHFHEARIFAQKMHASGEFVRLCDAIEPKLRAVALANIAHLAPHLPTERRTECALFITGGFLGLARWWIESGMTRSPAEMHTAFAAMCQRILAA